MDADRVCGCLVEDRLAQKKAVIDSWIVVLRQAHVSFRVRITTSTSLIVIVCATPPSLLVEKFANRTGNLGAGMSGQEALKDQTPGKTDCSPLGSSFVLCARSFWPGVLFLTRLHQWKPIRFRFSKI